MSVSVWLFLAEGFEEAEAIVPWDMFLRASFDVTAWGLGSNFVTGSHGITVKANKVWPNDWKQDHPEVVFLPGGMPGSKNLAADPDLKSFLKAFEEKKLGTLTAICAAPVVVLGAHGLLNKKRFTCYPGMESQAPGGLWTDGDVVVDGDLMTSRGMGTAAQLALHVIEKYFGHDKAEELGRKTLWMP